MLFSTRKICASLLSIAALGVSPDARADGSQAQSSSHDDPVQMPRPGMCKQVSLHGILAFADEHAPALRQSRAERRLADAEVEAASVWLSDNPQLEASAGPKMNHAGGKGIEVEVGLSQPIEIAGQRGLRIDAAQARRQLFDLSYEQRRWAVHRQVHEAFHNALVARERALVAGRVLAFATKLDDITRRQLQAGEVSNVEARLAAGELAQARQASVAAQGVARLARIRLAEVSGWPTADPPAVAGKLDEPRQPPALPALLERARRDNPSLLMGASATRLARAQAAVANRQAWPTPTLGVVYGHERDPGESSGLHMGLFTLGLPLPLWDRNQGERARAAAIVGIAKDRQEIAATEVEAEIMHAHAAVDIAAERIAAFGAEVIPAFEENLGLLERAYELGEIDLLQMMVARGRFLEVEREALSAYDDYFASVARLEALLGTEVWEDEHHGDHAIQENSP